MAPAKLTAPQRTMLAKYVGMGLTAMAFGRIDVWSALVRKGYLRRSHGLGVIESEITDTGRQAIAEQKD